MATIDPTSSLLAQIRTQLAAVSKVSPQKPKTPATAGPEKKRQQANLADLIFQRVASIDPSDPDRRRKAFRIFLESVLVNELGSNLLNDPAFYRLVDQVQQAMEAEEKFRPIIDQAGDYLLNKTQR